MTTFRDLGVLPAIADALEERGIVEPFPIQEMTLPIALLGHDVIGQGRTGTGKTLAFGIPLLQRIVAPSDRDYADLVDAGKPQALVILPTRELTVQVARDLEAAAARRRVHLLAIYGGRAYEPQVTALQSGVDVVVGTPGRLLDLANQGELDLSHVKVLVLDEADEMLDLGFLTDVEKLLARTPELRQTMLFSATMPGQVIALARKYMRHPLNVRGETSQETATVPATAQFVYRAHILDKDELVAHILQAEERGLAMIFCRTKRQAQKLADELDARGFAAAAVHGDLGQSAREQALRAFRGGKVDILVATDVAARGIDVEGVTHVINFSCPEDEKVYLHRIGRTGRAGASGIAVTLVDWEDLARWQMINRALDLPYPDPAEVYSTSETVQHDLGIPAGVSGVLPEAQRTRVGLTAERIEDLGETGRARSRRARATEKPSRRRPRQRTRGGVATVAAGSPDSPKRGTADQPGRPANGDSDGSSANRPRRQRRRTRRGAAAAESAKPTAGATAGNPDTGSRVSR